MRIVTWNCNGAFREKYAAIEALNADIAIIQECEDPEQSTRAYQAWAGNHAWIGHRKHKGVGVFPRRGQRLERLDWPQLEGGLFLPVRLDDTQNILAVWTLSRKAPQKLSYIAQFWHYLKLHKHRLGPDTIMCGDFNSNQIWDKKSREGNHSHCVAELADLGFHSLYHLTSGEAQGQERQPTFFLRKNEGKPYHIDYVFAHEDRLTVGWAGAQVGKSADWLSLSDHLPVIVDL